MTATIATGTGALNGTTTVITGADGRAVFVDLAITGLIGPRTLSFTAGTLKPALSGIITLTAGPASQLGFVAVPGHGHLLTIAASVFSRRDFK